MLLGMSSLSDINAENRGKDGNRFWSQGCCKAVGGVAGGATENTWRQAFHVVGAPRQVSAPYPTLLMFCDDWYGSVVVSCSCHDMGYVS